MEASKGLGKKLTGRGKGNCKDLEAGTSLGRVKDSGKGHGERAVRGR